MISRKAITALMDAGLITVTPAPLKIGPNSIDLRLGTSLKTYHKMTNRVVTIDPVSGKTFRALAPHNPPPLVDVPKVAGSDYWLLVPGQFYLGVTLEETYCRGVIPHLDGRSTCGRLSIEAHKTAGVGDNGFKGRWTLELEVTEPVIVRPGDRLFQIYFTPAWGKGLALLIRSLVAGSTPSMNSLLEVSCPSMSDPTASGLLFEMDDLYGQDDGAHHYQDSSEVRGASPLD